MQEQVDLIFESFSQFYTQLATYLPKIVGAIIILIFGWLIAKIVKMVAVKGLKLVRLNVVAEKAGIEKFLVDGGTKKPAVEIIGALFYWLIMLIVILAAFNALGLRIASELFNQVVLFIPNIIVAVMILIMGLFLAKFVSEVVLTYVKNIGFHHAEVISNITQYAIVVFVVSITLTQLNIGEKIVTTAFQAFFGAVCLALALAFGLGGRDWAKRQIDKFMD
ncbi:hypothetical protein ACFL4T_09240 [candidate division KSB1 bacterium]